MKKQKLLRFISLLFFMLSLAVLCSFFYGKCGTSSNIKDKLKEHKKEDAAKVKEESNHQRNIDSSKKIQLFEKGKIEKSNSVNKLIKKNYNEKRDIISNLDDDKSTEFFSDWISKIDTFK